MENEKLLKFYEKETEIKRFTLKGDKGIIYRVNLAFLLLPKEKMESVLDLGCGDGTFCHLLLSKNKTKRVIGIDLALNRLNYAKSVFKEGDFIRASLSNLPFKNNVFTLVSAMDVLEHLTDYNSAMKEIARVSKKYVMITVPNNQIIRKVLCPHCLLSFHLDGHLHTFNEKKLKSLFYKNRLSVEKIEYYSSIFELPQLRKFPKLIKSRILGQLLKRINDGGWIGVLGKKR